jgi:hyperosmotically inducible protein
MKTSIFGSQPAAPRTPALQTTNAAGTEQQGEPGTWWLERCRGGRIGRGGARRAVNVVSVSLLALSALLLGHGPLVASETDENLEAAARGAYVFRKLLAEEGISIEVSNGTVTLRGSVDTNLQRELAEEAVSAHAGVRHINNEISVKPVTTTDPDTLLARTVKSVLAWHRSGRVPAAHLEVKEGVVILKGEAPDEAAKALVAEYAGGIEGVKGVRNELALRPSKPGDDLAPKTSSDQAAQSSIGIGAASEVDDPSVAAQARMALRAHQPTRSLKAGVEVSEGVLTLTGQASTEEEKELAARLCTDIYGVRKVVNKMTLEPESTENLQSTVRPAPRTSHSNPNK